MFVYKYNLISVPFLIRSMKDKIYQKSKPKDIEAEINEIFGYHVTDLKIDNSSNGNNLINNVNEVRINEGELKLRLPPFSRNRTVSNREFELLCQDIEMCTESKYEPWPPLRKVTDDVFYNPSAEYHVAPLIPEDEFNARNFGQLNTIGFLLQNGYIKWEEYNFIYYKIRFDGVKESIVPSNFFLFDEELKSISNKLISYIKSIKERPKEKSSELLFNKFLGLINYSEPYWVLNFIYQDYKTSLYYLSKKQMFLLPKFPISRAHYLNKNSESSNLPRDVPKSRDDSLNLVMDKDLDDILKNHDLNSQNYWN